LGSSEGRKVGTGAAADERGVLLAG